MGSPEIPIAELLAATAIIPSLLAITFIVAFTVTLILLIRKIRNSQTSETLTRAEANYSTIGPPMPPVRIERNMSYEERAIHAEVSNPTDTNNFMEANNSVVLDNINLQLMLHESGTPTRNLTVNNMSFQGETLPTEHESTPESESNTQEYRFHQPRATVTGGTKIEAYGNNIDIAPEIQAQGNVAYNSNFSDESFGSQDLRSPDEDATEMVSNQAYGTDVSIAPEIQTQLNLAYESSHT